MRKIVTMGEMMLRLSPKGFQRFVQADTFQAIYGGGEANVAVSLSNFGHESYFVSKLPEHEIGQAALNALRRFGVQTDYIARGGGRLGIYYAETGASMRPSKVIYDRSNSAIAQATVDDFDFDAIFEGKDWFHISGITPAISENCAELTEYALKKAKEKNLTVSIDLNYRKKLWTPEKAQQTMKPFMKYVDVCIGNEEDAALCLGFHPSNVDVSKAQIDAKSYEKIFRQMKEEFGFQIVSSTLRESYSASKNGWSACIYDGTSFYTSKKYDIQLVDRIGGGDSFSAGLIHRLVENKPLEEALEFAVAASALKQTIPGDFNMVTEEEVERLKTGDASGRVQR